MFSGLDWKKRSKFPIKRECIECSILYIYIYIPKSSWYAFLSPSHRTALCFVVYKMFRRLPKLLPFEMLLAPACRFKAA